MPTSIPERRTIRRAVNKPVTYPVLAAVLASAATFGSWVLKTRDDAQKQVFEAHVSAENTRTELLTSSVIRQEMKFDYMLQRTGIGLPAGMPTAKQALQDAGVSIDGGNVGR